MPAILDVAIGTVFVFLLFSLVISALNEVILSKFDQRAKFLHMGLQELFGEASDAASREWRGNWKARLTGGLLSNFKLSGMTRTLCEHGLINALARTDKPGAESPSYIPAGSFVTALLSIISRTPQGTSATAQSDVAKAARLAIGGTAETAQKLIDELKKRLAAPRDSEAIEAIAAALRTAVLTPGGLDHTAENIERWIDAIPQKQLRESLQSLFFASKKDVQKFKAAVEGWFNATMDRVSGWYKRFAQKWMIALGFLLAVLLNVDTVHIVRDLSVSPNLAKAVASQAESYVRSGEHPMTEREAAAFAQETLQKATEALTAAQGTGNPDAIAKAQQAVTDAEFAADADAKFDASIDRLSQTGIPIGWDKGQRAAIGIGENDQPSLKEMFYGVIQFWHLPELFLRFCSWFSHYARALVPMIIGWALTAIAASLGAPFWFDTLNRFVNLRNAGRPPGEKDPTSKSTLPPPSRFGQKPGHTGDHRAMKRSPKCSSAPAKLAALHVPAASGGAKRRCYRHFRKVQGVDADFIQRDLTSETQVILENRRRTEPCTSKSRAHNAAAGESGRSDVVIMTLS